MRPGKCYIRANRTYLAHTLQVRVTPCDVGLGNTQHIDGGLVQSDKHSVVDLSQSEQLQYFTDLVEMKILQSRKT